MRATPIRVLIADDESLLRTGVRLILEHADDLVVVAEAADGAEAVAAAVEHRADVALLDIRMPGVDGLAAVAELSRIAPAVKSLVLTTFGEYENLATALQAGAAGFLLKDTGPQELIQAVRTVAGGHAVLAPQLTRHILDRYVRTGDRRASELISSLSQRERDVLVLVGAGLSNAEIARDLFMGEGTVKTHISRILAKLRCSNRVQAAILAHDAGILSDR
ncbi:response regulator [Nonomuraea ceibae]|uniref:response regulator n=1 Tax=Nonomuraea ceibae TaxID=1935170 RepID=UPI001C6071BB|nr:response regulator transcription factor [Nonomuraea ceibae]